MRYFFSYECYEFFSYDISSPANDRQCRLTVPLDEIYETVGQLETLATGIARIFSLDGY